MTPPVRLLDSTRNPEALELLRAGLAERPRAAAFRATALAVGVSSSVVATSTTATAAATSAATLATPSLAAVAAKCVAVGTLAGLALAGTATWVSSAREAAPAAPKQPTIVQTATTMAAPRVDPPGNPIVVAAPSALKSWAKPAKNAPFPASSAVLPAAQSLSREVAMIDGARRSLGSGDAFGALQRLDEYAAAARTGTLDREAQLLRIDALSQSGQRAAALGLATRYLTSYPNDPHAARLRTLVSSP